VNIHTVGVVGLGLMGSSIAACIVRHGYRVIGCDLRRDAVRNSPSQVRRALLDLKRHDSPNLDVASRLKRYHVTTKVADLALCDLVVEAIVEDKRAKRRVIAGLERVLSPRAVIASNTSSIPISMLLAKAKHPGRIIGMHWAEPAHITRFMEIVCGTKTSAATRDRAMAFGKRCGKEPSVLRKDIRGFITNRCFYALLREAFHLVESGVCTVADVDRSLRNDLGWWITLAGPFRFMDLTGIPAYKTVMEDLNRELSCNKRVPALMRNVVASGAKGVSNAKGFYRYTRREAKAWEEKFVRFSHDIRKLALKYPEIGS
jgi:3-hydroxybutyryl-CoA dehydrogenase